MSAHAATLDIYHFSDAGQLARFQSLTQELRCLVCQNQTVAESNAKLAADLRTEIANKIRLGESDKLILQYLVDRYGDYILYKPPVVRATYLLWFGPFLGLLVGLVFLMVLIRRRHGVR